MCGIVGAVAPRNVVPMLMEGLRRLEYRGYDSSGIATIDADGVLRRERAVGKVRELESLLGEQPMAGAIGIAHTRWATHGRVTAANAHPHLSADRLALVHNGIIENHQPLRSDLKARGIVFNSETDTEVIVHMVDEYIGAGDSLFTAVQKATSRLEGAYALAVISIDAPDRMVVARRGGPLVIGFGDGENFVASDIAALVSVTRRFVVLEEGDVAEITVDAVHIHDRNGVEVTREERISQLTADAVDLGDYRHFMQKEIFEQPRAIAETLEGRITGDSLLEASFGPGASAVFDRTQAVQIIACGTSYHAALVARYWLEEFGMACDVEIASEFRYRRHVVAPDTLVVAISQSGETIDTLAALDEARRQGFGATLAICNRAESSLVRACDLVLMTHAGPEIGVASTKAFTTQLVALLLLGIALGRRRSLTGEQEAKVITELRSLPARIEQALALDETIQSLAVQFADKQHALFLGRGAHYPIALEGALKLKEISYIHAEAYAAGELKHGPLALVDVNMPVVAVAPNDTLLEKLKSNIQEVQARGGRLLVFADSASGIEPEDDVQVVSVACGDEYTAPIVYTIPLQLLAYHVALIKGTDVDKPRNLAKSVTVE